jgi:hypothetical protein
MVPFARVGNVYGDDPNVVPSHIDRKQDMKHHVPIFGSHEVAGKITVRGVLLHDLV